MYGIGYDGSLQINDHRKVTSISAALQINRHINDKTPEIFFAYVDRQCVFFSQHLR